MDYREIVKLRSRAEASADPVLYEQAAAEFAALGMLAAAQRCRERAGYYRLSVFDPVTLCETVDYV